MTEQDVVNEEMYEEEDDDLPMQYRRLTAHLNTGNADFNRRLSAYLTGQIATRNALDQVIAQSLYRQYPNAPQFAQYNPFAASYPSPMMPQTMQQTPDSFPQSPYAALPAQTFDPTNPQPFMNIPGNFHLQQQQHHQQQPQQKNNSIQSPSLPTPSDQKPSFGLMQANQSTPMASMSSLQGQNSTVSPNSVKQLPVSTPSAPETSAADNLPTHTATEVQAGKPVAQNEPIHQVQPSQRTPLASYPYQANFAYGFNPPQFGFGPYNPTLPPESQMLVGSALNPTDPFTAALLASNSSNISVPFYSYNPTNASTTTSSSTTAQAKLKDLHPTYNSLTQTLAPSALEITPTAGANEASANTTKALPLKSEGPMSPMPVNDTSSNFDTGFEEFFGSGRGVGKLDVGQGANGLAGGTCTPGTENDMWSSFIDGNAWEDAVS